MKWPSQWYVLQIQYREYLTTTQRFLDLTWKCRQRKYDVHLKQTKIIQSFQTRIIRRLWRLANLSTATSKSIPSFTTFKFYYVPLLILVLLLQTFNWPLGSLELTSHCEVTLTLITMTSKTQFHRRVWGSELRLIVSKTKPYTVLCLSPQFDVRLWFFEKNNEVPGIGRHRLDSLNQKIEFQACYTVCSRMSAHKSFLTNAKISCIHRSTVTKNCYILLFRTQPRPKTNF